MPTPAGPAHSRRRGGAFCSGADLTDRSGPEGEHPPAHMADEGRAPEGGQGLGRVPGGRGLEGAFD
ncbi:MAG: hypothetical protein ACRD0H_01955, partial [Actinomycetes bacterium]